MLHNRYKIKGGEDESTIAEADLLRRKGHELELVELHNDDIPLGGSLQTGLSAIWSDKSYRLVKAKLELGSVDILHVQNFFPRWSPSVYYAAAACKTTVVQAVRNYRLICPAATLFRDGQYCDACVGKIVPWPAVRHACYQESRIRTSAVAAMIATHRVLGTWTNAVHQYVALTQYVRGKLIAGRLPANRISVKPNFLLDPSINKAKDLRDAPFVYVGRFSKEKGLDILLDAWRLPTEQKVELVGGGQIPQTWHLPSGVRVIGQQTIEETYSRIAKAKALILPSSWAEPFGRVVIESFALGTPVICSAVGALPELVEHEVTGLLVEPGNSSALRDAINRLAEDRALAEQLSRNARAKYLACYSENINYSELMSIYGRALKVSGFRAAS
jgi:glycosyltransferase involved in cell wall biosynthesis